MSRRKLRTRADGERVTFRTFAEPGLFLLPFLIGLLVFTVYPFINVILLSFRQDYSLMTGEFVCHGTVINQIVLPHQGVALVGEDFIFFGHSGTSK